MFEIDAVRHAIETDMSCDELSDCYLQLIELATRPQLSDANLASIARRQRKLQKSNEIIMGLLVGNKDMAEFYDDHNGRTLVGAYNETLAVVEAIVGATTRQQG